MSFREIFLVSAELREAGVEHNSKRLCDSRHQYTHDLTPCDILLSLEPSFKGDLKVFL